MTRRGRMQSVSSRHKATMWEMVMLKRIVALLMLAGIVLGVASCNTVEGAGRDIKATGNAIEKAADSAKPK